MSASGAWRCEKGAAQIEQVQGQWLAIEQVVAVGDRQLDKALDRLGGTDSANAGFACSLLDEVDGAEQAQVLLREHVVCRRRLESWSASSAALARSRDQLSDDGALARSRR